MIRVPLAKYPGMNRFVLDWLGGDERFLPRRATPLGRPVTLIAGQQVGFAGGPLYTLAKLATLVRMKRDLERQGTPAKAYFWLATEDHDFDEAATLCVPSALIAKEKEINRQLDLVCMRAVRTADRKAVVGSQPIPETLVHQLLAFFDLDRPDWLREGITFRDSFAELIRGVFGDEITLLDALDPELRRAGAPLFEQIRTKHADIQHALRERGRALQAAGYHEQVVPTEEGDYTLLFELDDRGNRHPSTASASPERTSTSALTRPLLQDFVLRPDVFIGGPAEVAYYAQIAPLHELLGVTMPRVALRGHVLVAPKRVARALDRYGIDVADVFTSPDALLAQQESDAVANVRAIVEQGKRELLQRVQELGELALPADHSLSGSIQRSIGHLEYHWNKLGERALKGLVRKDRERYAATRELVSTLYPDRHVQDRITSWFAYWCIYGDALVEQLIEAVEPDRAFFGLAVL